MVSTATRSAAAVPRPASPALPGRCTGKAGLGLTGAGTMPVMPPAALPAPLCGSSAHPLVRVGRGSGAATAGAVDLSRARVRGWHLLVSQQLAGANGTGDGAPGAALGWAIMTSQPTFPTLLEGFFTQRLMQQRQASAHTIASYRDTFRLLLQFAQKRLRRAPSTLALEDIDAPLVVSFLDELEKVREVTVMPLEIRALAVSCRNNPDRPAARPPRRLDPRRLCRQAGSEARPAAPDRAGQPARTETAPHHQEVPAEPVRLRHQPGAAADQ
jgi:hypothetical protein